ncbi:hypothetical protein CEXT_106841 [Caerostris extrusa]|uniref:Uncharacterized protein n=1 Tax=Caerostris extrusa TaxID=172846 RepID=A0AAV4SJS0_CAEEX|nr:hypothetical protein CEXT_106841 [Caerostris extrusa]
MYGECVSFSPQYRAWKPLQEIPFLTITETENRPLRYESLRQRNLFELFIVWDLLDLFLQWLNAKVIDTHFSVPGKEAIGDRLDGALDSLTSRLACSIKN